MKKQEMKQNQWVLVPEVLRAIERGNNTLELLLIYFPATELRSYCGPATRPYTMMAKLLRDLRKAGAIEYNTRTKRWTVKKLSR